MDLPSSYHFEGWNIRYSLAKAADNNSATDGRRQPKTVVFVHGTAWSSAVFQPIIEALLATEGPQYHILSYDLPGYGQSQEYTADGTTTVADFAGDTSVAAQARALTGLLQHVQLDGSREKGHPAPAVIAHDIAGTIVLRAHLIDGCEFESLMLLDTNTVLPWGDGFYKLVRAEPQTFLKLPASIFEAVVRAVIRSAVHDPKVLETGWEDVLARPWLARHGVTTDEAQRSFVRQIAQANDGDVAEMLEGDMYGHVRCDVKVVWGDQDQWIPREKMEDLIRRLGERAKEFVVIPNAGHLIMLDQPTRFAIEVFDWLSRSRSPGSH